MSNEACFLSNAIYYYKLNDKLELSKKDECFLCPFIFLICTFNSLEIQILEIKRLQEDTSSFQSSYKYTIVYNNGRKGLKDFIISASNTLSFEHYLPRPMTSASNLTPSNL